MDGKSNTTTKSPKRRGYSSPLRQAQAQETRLRILRAAVSCFSSYGYSRSTLAMIGREANVSPESVAAAGPKAALLVAAFEYAFTGQDGEDPIAAREDIARIFALKDPDAMAAGFGEFFIKIHAKGIDMWRAVQDGAAQDEGAAELYRALMQRRHDECLRVVRMLDEVGMVRHDQPLEVTAGTLALINSFDPYQLYVRDFGWSEEQTRQWFIEIFKRNILAA